MTRVFILSILLSLFIYPLPGPKDDAGDLLKRVVANLKAHDLRSQNYTFTEDYHNINYDKKLKMRLDETAKYETVFVEGTPYKRKIEENGKPLSGKADEEEQNPISGNGRRTSPYQFWGPNRRLFIARSGCPHIMKNGRNCSQRPGTATRCWMAVRSRK